MAATGILIKDLAAKTTLSDDDLVVIGEGSDAKKMTIAKLKELIGIDALNTKTAMESNNFHVRVPICVKDSHVSAPSIPFMYPDGYTITLSRVQMFGGSEQPSFGWTVQKDKNSINLYINNSDAAFYFGTTYPENLWDLYFKVTKL